jgi:hypothetical protein
MGRALTLGALLGALVTLASTTTFAAPIFTDNFTNGSTIGGASVPGGTPTASTTSYDIASTKATTNVIGSGSLSMQIAATTSGVFEAQAIFSSTPVALSSIGDSINLRYTFTATPNILAGNAAANSALYAGLYSSGTPSVAPLTTLASSGLTATAGSPNATGGTQLWRGYVQRINFTGGSSQSYTRPQQTGTNTTSANQDLVGNAAGGGLYTNPAGTAIKTGGGAVALTSGQQYTYDYTISLSNTSELTIASNLFSGVTATGSPLFTQTGTASGGTFLTSSFDGLAFGYRYSGTSGGVIQLPVNAVAVSATIVPEPASIAVVSGLGMAAVIIARRRLRT